MDDSEEDNFIHRRQFLRSYPDCEVSIAVNGRRALDVLKARMQEGRPTVDLICLDVNMPVLDAWGFLAEYAVLPKRAMASYIALMVSTALPSTARQIAESSKYVNFFISKPFDAVAVDEKLTALRAEDVSKN